MSKRALEAVRPLDGISFEIEQLTTICALSLTDIRIEVRTTAPGIEEQVVFRLNSAPDLIAATLHRSSNGLFIVVGYDLFLEANLPFIEAIFPNFGLATYALTQLFAVESV